MVFPIPALAWKSLSVAPGSSAVTETPPATQLFAQGLGEGEAERLGRPVGGLVRRRLGGRDRGRDEDASTPVDRHVACHPLGHMHQPGDVDRDEPELVFQVVIDERASEADAHVERSGIYGTPQVLDESPESFHAIVGARVGLIGVSLYAFGAERLGGLVNAIALSGDGDVEAVIGELLGQLEADAARASGYHRELVLALHASSFLLVCRGYLPLGACTLTPLSPLAWPLRMLDIG